MGNKILLVDDEPKLLLLVKSRLEASGYEVITAADGEEALAMIPSEKPDLLVLDIMMPKIDGLQVCTQVKNDPGLKQIPIIILTAKSQREAMIEAKKSRANSYVVKPFRPEVLLAEVKKYLL
ncbi:MAG: response regulator [bacterium]|nr:response regulator [bacterium]MDD5354873.1 response regulator [bacterium]MDD5756664.1 response regulator [bacterium]